MEGPFKFSTFHRNHLAKVLRKHGCEHSVGVAYQMEELAREYHRRTFSLGNRLLTIESLGQAQRILHHANIACQELDGLTADNLRRFKRERRRREEELSFDRYKEAVNDVCMFAIYAMEKAEALVWQSRAPADVALRHLIFELENLWVRNTGRRLPELPLVTEHRNETWKRQRALERHPIWIILDGLRIDLDGSGLAIIVKAACHEPDDETA